MDATITIKMTPLEFDMLRKTLEAAMEAEEETQQNIRDSALNLGNEQEKQEAVQAGIESQAREAQYALILQRIS